MGVIRSMLGRAISTLPLLLLVLGGAAHAEPSEAERAARWSDLRHAIFGDRVVEDAGDRVAIDVPARAEDAAIVPVAIRVAETLGPEIRGLYLVIDDNPSPLAAHFVVGPLADTKEITTRVRIDDYTYLHAVAETIAERLRSDAPINAKLLISHPNSSGLQMDQVSRNYIPANFMQTLDVTYNGQSVFRLESDIAISEDPSFSFSFRPSDPASPGVIKAEILDSSQRHFTQSWPVAAAPQM